MPHSERVDAREQRHIGVAFRVELGALCTTELTERPYPDVKCPLETNYSQAS